METQKHRLLQEKEKVEKKLKEIAFKVPGYKEEWEAVARISSLEGAIAEDEKADRIEELQTRHETEHLLEERLRRIKRSLDKIERGDYGICERCREPISRERLKIEPEAELCQKCASKIDLS